LKPWAGRAARARRARAPCPGAEYVARVGAHIPSAAVEIWPGHGHYPHLLDPDRFLALLTDFERRLPAA
jgi:pimeloyl-ACP methyl ester carboxylesterase